MANEQNLKPLTTEKAREIGKMGGVASGKAKKEKKLMSQIYSEFLEKGYYIEVNGNKTKLSGNEIVSRVMLKILNRGDSASVSLMREVREGVEGRKIDLTSNVPITINIIGVDPEQSGEKH